MRMTDTERALQKALDADPTDQVARRALADLLIEAGDKRGPGYKALAELEAVPASRFGGWWYFGSPLTGHPPLHYSWTKRLMLRFRGTRLATTRRRLENSAALAWAELTPKQQATVYATLTPSPAAYPAVVSAVVAAAAEPPSSSVA